MQTSDSPRPSLFEKLTSYRPLLWLSLAFMLGIVADGLIRQSRGSWRPVANAILPSSIHLSRYLWFALAGVILLAVLLIYFLAFRRKRKPFDFRSSRLLLVAFSLISFTLGAARYHFTIPQTDAHHIAWYADREYELLITGTLVNPPDERDTYTNLRVEVSGVNTGDETLPVSGLILARVDAGEDWHYGDVVRLRGHLKTPPSNESFSYQEYLAHQGILAYMPDAEATLLPFSGGNPLLKAIYSFKAAALGHIYSIFPDPEASLLGGILLGDDNGLPADLQQAYKNTGTAHIIAISGFNIAIIAALFVGLFSRLLGARKGAIAAVAGIVLYTVLVGASASVVRAAIMGGLAIFARQLGRRQNGLNTLFFTGAVMTVINPDALWDVGFQLSFAATFGLIVYAQPFRDWAVRQISRFTPAEKAHKYAEPISEYLLFTLAAQLTTLPIVAYQFGRISLVALLANPFILPVQPAVMVLGGLALWLSFIYLPLGRLVGWLAWPFAAYTNRAVEFFDRLPHGVIVLGDFSFLFVLLFYGLLLAVTFADPRLKRTLRVALAPSVIVAALSVFAYLAWAAAFAAPDGRLHLTFLDVGSADAILVQTPSGRAILINGGESTSTLSSALGQRLSPFDRRLDWLLVASPQEQEVAALPRLLDRFPVENVLWAGNPDASYSAGQVSRWLTDSQTPLTPAYTGAALDLGAGARLEVLASSSRGAVLLISWNGFRALLPFGVTFDVLNELKSGKAIGPVTVLLLADSGYAPSNPPEWLANVHPQAAVLSVEAGDPDGLPDPSVLNALEGITLLRTDQNGWIDISTDGQGMWVEVERK